MYNNTMTEELNELRNYLISKGYKVWDTKYEDYNYAKMITQKLQKRVDTDNHPYYLPVCNCNDKLLLNIDICQAKVHGNVSITIEMSLVHSNIKDEWCDLRIYALKPEQLYGYWGLEEKEDRLLKMWEIFYNEE